MKLRSKSGWLVWFAGCAIGATSMASAAQALVVVPARSENAAEVQRGLASPAGRALAPAPAPTVASGADPARNFGKVVSPEAKVFRDDPIPGYRNFGAWVSSQRRHRKGDVTPGPVPTGAPTPPPAPSGTGSFGT